MEIIRAPYKRTRVIASQGEELEQHIVTPGDVITQNLDFMKSHGTAPSHDHICATVAGAVYKTAKCNVRGVLTIFRLKHLLRKLTPPARWHSGITLQVNTK
ncbi:exosome complex component RRP4-like [Bolinopsis microptera]|uniref:exosome complex component RRP4-like n=1 Tax=Bolinopsis microptera TaxID=2820187 RepID=UPI0030799687